MIGVLTSPLQCFERELPSDYVKALLTGLAQTKSPDLPYILPVFSGTSYDGFSNQVRAAGFKLTELPLGLLTGANMIAMVEKVRSQACGTNVYCVFRFNNKALFLHSTNRLPSCNCCVIAVASLVLFKSCVREQQRIMKSDQSCPWPSGTGVTFKKYASRRLTQVTTEYLKQR